MNTKLMRQIADLIETKPDIFNQNAWGDEVEDREPGLQCTSPCCIASLATALSGERFTDGPTIRAHAEQELELTQGEAGRLFADGWPGRWFQYAGVTPANGEPAPDELVVPNASDAVPILRAIADAEQVWL